METEWRKKNSIIYVFQQKCRFMTKLNLELTVWVMTRQLCAAQISGVACVKEVATLSDECSRIIYSGCILMSRCPGPPIFPSLYSSHQAKWKISKLLQNTCRRQHRQFTHQNPTYIRIPAHMQACVNPMRKVVLGKLKKAGRLQVSVKLFCFHVLPCWERQSPVWGGRRAGPLCQQPISHPGLIGSVLLGLKALLPPDGLPAMKRWACH